MSKPMSKKSDNIQIKGFVLANDKPLAVSSKALEDSVKTTTKIFDFKNQDLVEELIKSNKRKKKPEPVKKEEEENNDDDIEWSDVDENELSRTINELDQSLKRPNESPVKSPRKSFRKDN